MLESALKVIQTIEEHDFEAYIVGGFVRDWILGLNSNDIDICTSAKPKDLINIFDNATLPKEDYGSVIISIKNYNFQITTFRTEVEYSDYRHPDKIEYVNDLDLDLLRRDFTINTICMDKHGLIIDRLGARHDLENKIIKTVGDSSEKFHEDALRILRAIRFASKLDFQLDDEVKKAIGENKELLKSISYERKREELDKIFTCSNPRRGLDLIIELELQEVLELGNLENIKDVDSLIGIWAMIDVKDNTYPFTSSEKTLINSVRKVLKLDVLDSYNLYKYGLYACSTAGIIKGISRGKVAQNYNNLIIHSRKDLDITSEEIMTALNILPGPTVSKVYSQIEREVLEKRLKNKKSDLLKYCIQNFSSDIRKK